MKISINLIVESELWSEILKEDNGNCLTKVENEKNTFICARPKYKRPLFVNEAAMSYGKDRGVITDEKKQEMVIYKTNGLIITPYTRTINNGNKFIVLKKQSMKLLEQLLMDSKIIHSRKQLCQETNEEGPLMDDNALNACICRLRKELSEICSDELIKTYSTLGYKWIYEVEKKISKK